MNPAVLPSISLLEKVSTYRLEGFEATFQLSHPSRLACEGGVYSLDMANSFSDFELNCENELYHLEGQSAKLQKKASSSLSLKCGYWNLGFFQLG